MYKMDFFKYLHYFVIAYVILFLEWYHSTNILIQAGTCLVLKRMLQRVWPEVAYRPDGGEHGMPSGHALICTSFFVMDPSIYSFCILFICTFQRTMSLRHSGGQVIAGSLMGLWMTPVVQRLLRGTPS